MSTCSRTARSVCLNPETDSTTESLTGAGQATGSKTSTLTLTPRTENKTMKFTLTAMIAASTLLLPSIDATAATKTSASKSRTHNASSARKDTRKNNRRATVAAVTSSPSSSSKVANPTPTDCDLDNNRWVDVNDIMTLLPLLGSPCNDSDCQGDINKDAQINVNDLMVLIANYGSPAPPSESDLAETVLSGATLMLQHRYVQDASPFHDLGVRNNAVCVSAYGFLVSNTGTPEGMEKVLNHTSDEIADYLRYYANFYGIDTNTDGTVILDIEGHDFSPRMWGRYLDSAHEKYNPEMLDRILDAYILRIQVARDVFPNAKLGLYEITTPHPFGNSQIEGQVRRMRGYEYAAAYGILEGLDFACPVIYMPWGNQDVKHHKIADYTALGIETSRSLLRQDGTPVEIMPMISMTVFNGSSAHHGEVAPLEDVSLQINVMRDLGVEDFLIWNGTENLYNVNDDLYNLDYMVVDRLAELLDYLSNNSVTG